jgi:hypothetical protein
MTGRGRAVILKLNFSKSYDHKKGFLLGHSVRNSNVHPVCTTYTISPTNTATNPISVDQPYAGPAASCCSINGTYSIYIYIQCDSSIFEKVFIWFLGQPVVWSEPNMSQIEVWSSPIYAWYQEFEFNFFFEFFLNFKRKNFKKKTSKNSNNLFFNF